MNMNAPLSTPTSSGGRLGVVRGDLLAELGDAGLELVGGDDHLAEVGARRTACGRDVSRHGRQAYRRWALAPRTARAAADLAGDRPRRGRRRAPARRWRRRAGGARRPSRAATRARARARERRPARRRSARASVGSTRSRRARRGASASARSEVGLARRARRRRRARRWRRAAAAARGARGCGGTRGSSFDGSWTGSSPRSAQSAWVSRRRRRASGSAGRVAAGEPVEPGAPQQVEQHGLGLVVGGVAGEHVGRQRGVAGPPGARLEVGPGLDRRPRTARNAGAEPRRRRRDDVGLGREPGRRPWSTCTAVTSQPASTASTSSASESAPPDTAQVTAVPGRRERAAGQQVRVAPAWLSGSSDARRGCRRGARREQLATRRDDAELAADAAQAGVDVRPAHPELGGRLAHRRRGEQRLEQLALLVGEVAPPRPASSRPAPTSAGGGGARACSSRLEPGLRAATARRRRPRCARCGPGSSRRLLLAALRCSGSGGPASTSFDARRAGRRARSAW